MSREQGEIPCAAQYPAHGCATAPKGLLCLCLQSWNHGVRCSLRGGPSSGEAPGNHWQWQHQTQQELSTWPLYGVAIQQVGSNVQGTEMSSPQFLLPPFLRQTHVVGSGAWAVLCTALPGQLWGPCAACSCSILHCQWTRSAPLQSTGALF